MEKVVVPEGTVKITLEIGGCGDDIGDDYYEPGYKYLELYAHFENGIMRQIWEGSSYDNDDMQATDEMREELKKAFIDLGLDINEVIDLESSCVLDWEYPKWDQ